jgi:hypothetical protein
MTTDASPLSTAAYSGDRALTAARATEADKDGPLVEDIRLLGRLLGDVIREQAGTGRIRPDRTDPSAVGRLSA